MKKQSKMTGIRLSVFVFVCLLATGACILWWLDGLKAVDPSDKSIRTFSVEKGEGVKSITGRLYQAGLINSQTAFFVLLKLRRYDRKLQAGEFRLTKSMTAETVAEELTHGIMDQWTTVVEGLRREEVASLLSNEYGIPETEFLKLSREGYLFPDTYAIPKDATAGAILEIINTNFRQKAQPLLSQYTGSLTADEVIILASIVEREGKTDSDRPVIAGILLNRLEAGWPLQADATLQYALGYQPDERDWWKKYLTNDDKLVASPYNTYQNPGLPPGPIASPGLSAISAVTNPSQTDYMYYLHDPEGGIHYGRTLEEHNANIEMYLR